MNSFFTGLFITVSISVSAQTDTLKFWNGEYMVVRNDSVIYPTSSIVERAADFPGGQEAINQYVYKNLRLPVEVRLEKAHGKVNVFFYVDKTGLPTRLTAVGDTTLGRGAEALRLVNSMPRWKPAIQNGRPVQMRVMFPITFTVEGAKRKRK
jgi:hypothetical protein